MSTLNVLTTADRASLSILAEILANDANLPTALRGEMISALKTLGRVLGRELHMIPTVPVELRNLVNGALPTAAGVSGTRWRNVKSLVRKALAVLDPQVIPARSRAQLLASWAELLVKAEATSLNRELARFSKYCSEWNLGPA